MSNQKPFNNADLVRHFNEILENYAQGIRKIIATAQNYNIPPEKLNLSTFLQNSLTKKLHEQIIEDTEAKNSLKQTLEAGNKYFFTVWTEKETHAGFKQEYEEKYLKPPLTWGPLVWIDRIQGSYSILMEKRRMPIDLTSNTLMLLCLHLKRKNELLYHNTIEAEIPNHTQVLHQLHKNTQNLLKDFINVQRSEGQKLMLVSKTNSRIKFTFRLIEHYSL